MEQLPGPHQERNWGTLCGSLTSKQRLNLLLWYKSRIKIEKMKVCMRLPLLALLQFLPCTISQFICFILFYFWSDPFSICLNLIVAISTRAKSEGFVSPCWFSCLVSHPSHYASKYFLWKLQFCVSFGCSSCFPSKFDLCSLLRVTSCTLD